jgi:exopolysaccharide biosynthesis polyprenyl glycosylphosphotransferase
VNATERAALLQSVALYDELHSVVDDKTLEIVEHRRKTAVVRRRGWLIRRMLLLADVAGLFAAFLFAQWAFGNEASAVDHVRPDAEWLVFLLTLPGWIVVAKLYGLYDRDEERTDHSTVDDVVGVFHLVTVGAWLFFATAWLTGIAEPHMHKLVTFWALSILSIAIGRAVARALCRRSVTYLQNTIIIGAGDVGQTIARKLLNHPEYGINLVGFVDDDPKARREDLGHLVLLGGRERLPALVRLFDVERVIVAFSNESHEETLELIRSLKDLDVQIDIVPRLFELVSPSVGFHTVEGVPLVGLPPLRLSRSSRLLKRTADLAFTFVGLVLLAPLLAAIAVAVRLDSKGPVFFRQVRMGRGGTFRIWKFRTMTADADERKHEVAHLNKHLRNGGDPRMFKIPNDPRVTRVGAFLRRYSLDELPQLFNVVTGEMSLVGPRPLILDEDQYIDSWGRQRLDLKPGITGQWQVLGRTDIPFDEMVKLDYLYVTSWSLFTDLKLILRTVPVLVGSSATGT